MDARNKFLFNQQRSISEFTVGYIKVVLDSEKIDGKIYDTDVFFEIGNSQKRICTISGDKIPQFKNELTNLIEKYRI